MNMTVPNFLLALGIGAALIAFWAAVRFPSRCPENFRTALGHVGLALGVGWFAPDLFNAVASHGVSAWLAGVFAVLLPVLTYTFLAGAWFLMLVRDAVNAYRH